MNPITAAELTQIRQDAAVALDKDCAIQRNTGATKDHYGQMSGGTATNTTTKAGMTQPSAGQLQNYEYVVGSQATWLVKLPYGTDVQLLDILVTEGQKLARNV